MAEAIMTFQSQLSGVMETVFKAAMYEITRLVEDSFLEELTRCREQVESLQRRLKWAESRRKERQEDRRESCVDCGRVGMSGENKPSTTEKSLKQECVLQEELHGSQGSTGEAASRHMEGAKPDVQNVTKSTQVSKGPGVQGNKFDRLLKEEALQSDTEIRESQGWSVPADETDGSSLPGPSKRFSEQKIPKCHVDWETGFDQRPESNQDGHSGGPSEPLFQSRYSMDELSGFDKTGYGDTSMIDMGNFDELQGSSSHLTDDLSYVDQYDEDVEAPEEAEPPCYQTGTPGNRRAAQSSPTGSPSKTNNNVSAELSCLLINEEGYLQDPNVVYADQMSGDSGSRSSFRGHGIRFDPCADGPKDTYEPDTYSDTLNLGDRLQHQSTERGVKKDTCNQSSTSFSDSVSLKTHKRTHKGIGQEPPYSCNQCGKTFSQACNLKVHQRIHSGQGLHLCSHCGKGFPSFADLRTHKCGQTGDKPYCCTVCGNKFSRLWNLKLHRRIHTQEKPHRCNMCDKSFTRADILKVHQRTHTGERPYCCAVCGLSFKRLDHLKSHQRKHMTDLFLLRPPYSVIDDVTGKNKTHNEDLVADPLLSKTNGIPECNRHGRLTESTMSDLDTLIVTFQTQLSDVMEAVMKTAMFEVTRLVEDVFLVEVKRRNQEVETLRLQLQWSESNFSDDGGKTKRCIDLARTQVEQRADPVEERPEDPQGDMFRGCDVKNQGDSVEHWMSNHRHGVKTSSPDSPAATQSLEKESQATGQADVMPAVDMKEEEVNKPYCSAVHLRGWSSALDGEPGPESDNTNEVVEAPKQTQEKSEELLTSVIKQDPQISAAYGFSEDPQETHMAADRPLVSSLEMDSSWVALPVKAAGLLQNHRLGAEKECDPVKTKSSPKLAEHELSDSVRADVQFSPDRDHACSSESPEGRLQPSNIVGVTVKEEVIDSDGCDESGHTEKKLKKTGAASLSFSVKQHRVSSEAHKPNHLYHKATVQEVMKLHSKVGAGLRLQAAIHHLHRPMKKAPHTLQNSPMTALSIAHSQVVNYNNLNRIPSTSKTVAPPAISVQRVHQGDKQTSALSRTGDSWVGVKSQNQSANSHHVSPAPHPDSHPHAGPRHLLRCGQCGKCFPHPSNLKTHLQTHTGERPFCCSLCGRSFTKLSNLKAHRRVHTGERPYSCLACGKRFTQKCNLKRHQRIHLDV
ncbi:uncharacterized protein PAE49_003572 [Odontesthes bonariensis]|uniref:uncharacterized protein LOC142378156 n=1 Tax=Odontesthes bonariensis TaxID=219752 RepID=UPI003F585B28